VILLKHRFLRCGQVWWCTSVIPTIQDTDVKVSFMVKASPDQKTETLCEK
jgi:hypothetical protein